MDRWHPCRGTLAPPRAPARSEPYSPGGPPIATNDPEEQPVPDAPDQEAAGQRPQTTRSARRRRARTSGPQPPVAANWWPLATVVSLLFAVAGWTAVVVLVLTKPGAAGPASTPAANLPAASVADTTSHEAPTLEAALPTSAQGTALTTTSWLGGTILSDDDWSKSLEAFLGSHELSPNDLLVAQAYDPSGTLDVAAVAFQARTLTSKELVAAIIAAWRVDYPGLQTSTVTLGGKSVTKGVFPEEPVSSYWYTGNGIAFEIDTSNESIAADVLSGLP